MTSRLLRPIFFFTLAFGLATQVFFGSWREAPASARAGVSGVLAQQATDYPYPEDEFPTDSFYPVDTEIPYISTQDEFLDTETPEPTPEDTSTPAVNVFGTEDALMRDTLGTPASSATPAPSITPVNTQTAPVTSTAQEPGAGTGKENARLQIDWGFFWIGFAVPLLVACGAVLYLLDRRPDLFTPRRKP
jgi:hypothetical protein